MSLRRVKETARLIRTSQKFSSLRPSRNLQQKLINHLDDCTHHYWNFDHDSKCAANVVKVRIAYRGDEIIWILVILHGSQKQLYICILLFLLLLKVCPLLLCIQIL